MKRQTISPRSDWRAKLEQIGFTFHSLGGVYWHEAACYEFMAGEIDYIEAATAELHEMCIKAAEHIISHKLYNRLGIPAKFVPLIERSWEADEPSIYGRFDFAYDGYGDLKLFEYNADTPTSLIEAAVAQWTWLEEVRPGCDQFNSIHEKLIACFREIGRGLPIGANLFFSCIDESQEDFVTVEYMRDTAMQAGLSTRHVFIEDIGFSSETGRFYDSENCEIQYLFKLYPWEWMIADQFGSHLLENPMRIFEPAWKMLLSNKGILPVLWELYPNHPNMLPAFFEAAPLQGAAFVRKPLLSREGASITYDDGTGRPLETGGNYGAEGYIYQGLKKMPCFDGSYPVVGSWVIAGEPAGIGIREDDTPVTTNTSRFVPHFFKP